MIKKFDKFNENPSFVDGFQILYDKAPNDLKEIINATEAIEQSPKWHPEGNVLIHTRLVTNRLHNRYNDINLDLAGIFHDLGKIKTTNWDDKKQSWVAPGHEQISARIVEQFNGWIIEMGGDSQIVEYIVLNHMRFKFLDDFRFQEKTRFLNDIHFDYVHKFATGDFGGTDLEAKPLKDLSSIEDDIAKFNKEQEENKIISSKFNGKILMDIYPELKGKTLGDAINGFRKHITYDFRKYVLDTAKDEILKDFEDFYKLS